MTETWQLAREDNTWVGPLDINLRDVDDAPISFADATLSYAVVLEGTRPVIDDWAPLEPNSVDPTKLGVRARPVTVAGTYGVYVKVQMGSNIVILEPQDVGFILRT